MKNPSTFPKGIRITEATQEQVTTSTKVAILDDDNILDKYVDASDLGDKNFIYEQSTPSALWSITHPLNKKVSVTATDSAGTVIEGQITLNTGTQVEIQFNTPFWGYAYLN